jgi:hypothetical protein
MSFATGVFQERMRIDQNGNVGIGTTSPACPLEVSTRNNTIGIMHSASGSPRVFSKLGSNGCGMLYARNGTGGEAIYLSSEGNSFLNGGNVGVGTDNPQARLDVVGHIRISNSAGGTVLEMGEGLDYSEGFAVSDKALISPGSVLVIDAKKPGQLRASDTAYDKKVAGIVAGAKGLRTGVSLGSDESDAKVALAGRVYCNVDATASAVEAGDLLTTSSTPGYAMKAADYARAQGAILGKAMDSLEKGKKGQILVLVTLQ